MSWSCLLALVPPALAACGGGKAAIDAGPAHGTLPLIVYSFCSWTTGAAPPAGGTITVESNGVAIARADVSDLCVSPRGIGSTGIDGIVGQPVLEGCLAPGPTAVRIDFCAPAAKPVTVDLTVVAGDQQAYLPSCGSGTKRVLYAPLKLDIPVEAAVAGDDAAAGCDPTVADAAVPTVDPCWCAL